MAQTALEALPVIILGGSIINSFINNNLQGLILSVSTLLPVALLKLDPGNAENEIRTKGLGAFFTICNITTYFGTQIHQRIKSKDMSYDFDFPMYLMFFLALSVIGAGIIVSTENYDPTPSPITAGLFILSIVITYALSMLIARHGKGLGYFQNGSGSATDNVKCTRPSTQAFKCTLYNAEGQVLEAPWDSNVPAPDENN